MRQSHIFSAIYNTYDKFVVPTDAGAIANFHTDLKLGNDLWTAFKSSNNRLLVIFMLSTSSATTLADFKTFCANILETHFPHVHFD